MLIRRELALAILHFFYTRFLIALGVRMKTYRVLAGLIVLTGIAASTYPVAGAAEQPWSERMANASMARWPDGRFAPAAVKSAWNCELGTLLEGMDAVWLDSADGRYYNYIKDSVDQLVGPDGSIPTLKP